MDSLNVYYCDKCGHDVGLSDWHYSGTRRVHIGCGGMVVKIRKEGMDDEKKDDEKK